MRIKNNIFSALIIGLLLLAGGNSYAQNVAINNSGKAPNADAVLDLSSNAAGGFILPCMPTTNMNNISAAGAANSLLIYNTTVNCVEDYYTTCSCWQPVYCPCSAAPASNPAIAGTATVCASSVQTYTLTPVAGAASYTWTLLIPGGGAGYYTATNTTTVSGPSTTQSLECTANGTYTISVVAQNSCGSCVAAATTYTINVANTTPTVPLTPGGPNPICINSSQTYTVATVTGATNYQWTFTASAGAFTPASPITTATNSITVTAPALVGTGTVSVEDENACGNWSTASPTYTMNIITVPGTPGNPTGTGPYSVGNTYTYTTTGAANATSYTWTISGGGTFTGNGTTTITAAALSQAVNWTAAGTPTITVQATDACGNSAANGSSAFTVTSCPGTITIIHSNGSNATGNTSGCGVTSYTLTVGAVNDMILVACDGSYSSNTTLTEFGNRLPTITGPSGAVTVNSYFYSQLAYYSGVSFYWAVANVAGAYTISVNESANGGTTTGYDVGGCGANDNLYVNYAWDLTGFCSAPTVANFDFHCYTPNSFDNPGANDNGNDGGGGWTNTTWSSTNGLPQAGIPEAAGSAIIATFAGYWETSKTNSWTGFGNATSTGTASFYDPNDEYAFAWGNIATAVATPGQNITITTTGGCGYGVLYLIDVH